MKQTNGSADGQDGVTVLSSQTNIEGGTLRVDHDLTVRGRIAADVVVEGRMIVSTSARVDGDVEAKDLIIAGHVKGNVRVHGTLIVRSSAALEGTVRAHRLVVEEGASGSARLRIGAEQDLAAFVRRRVEEDERARVDAPVTEGAPVAGPVIPTDPSPTPELVAPAPPPRPADEPVYSGEAAWSNEIAFLASEIRKAEQSAARERGSDEAPASSDEMLRSREMTEFIRSVGLDRGPKGERDDESAEQDADEERRMRSTG